MPRLRQLNCNVNGVMTAPNLKAKLIGPQQRVYLQSMLCTGILLCCYAARFANAWL